MKSYNPATLEVVGEVEDVLPEELPNYIEKARKAQKEWMNWGKKKRKKVVKEFKKLLNRRKLEIARTISQETGKPKLEAVNTDLLPVISAADYSIGEMDDLFKRKKISMGGLNFLMRILGKKSYIHHRPLGIIGIISPWNYPFGIPGSELMMAIAAGNSAIMKPSSETPLTAMWFQELAEEAGAPEGLVQVLPGSGSKIGQAILESPDLDRIIFTGSVFIGKKVMESAAQNLTPVTLELGGKDPFIVLDDAHMERALNAAVWGSFLNSGQTCVGVKRIYCQEPIFEEFTQKLKGKVENLEQGYDWDDPEIDVGPVINEGALKDMEGHVTRAKEQGATILTGGERNEDMEGHFFKPTIIVDAKQSMDVVQQEIFGPIVVVMPFKTDEEAIELANDSPFALSGSVWTQDLKRGRKIAEDLSSGTIDVNNVSYTFGLVSTPWGGKGDSGFGRTHGKWGFEELMDLHHVHTDKGKNPMEIWWHPYNQKKLDASEGLIEHGFFKKIGGAISFLKNFLKISKQED